MAVKNNPISKLEGMGWWITSDPNEYYQSYNPKRGKKDWGQRDLMQYGINADAYCGGRHPAYDMFKYHGAPILSFVNATVLQGTGWNTFGWTTVLGFVDHNGIKRQVILGHLNSNPLKFLTVGQNVKIGDVVGHQGTSNTLGVSMASHLHIQFQNYKALGEWNFTCTGIDPLNIDITTSEPTANAGKTPKKSNETIANEVLAGKWGNDPARSINLKKAGYNVSAIQKIVNEKSKKKVTAKAPAPAKKKTKKKETPATFNKRKGRKARAKAYARGVVKSTNGEGAAYRRWSNETFKNTYGSDIPDGSVVYIFSTHKSGFARIYSHTNKGWIHLDQVQITHVYD